jgi:hypothetical protein
VFLFLRLHFLFDPAMLLSFVAQMRLEPADPRRAHSRFASSVSVSRRSPLSCTPSWLSVCFALRSNQNLCRGCAFAFAYRVSIVRTNWAAHEH